MTGCIYQIKAIAGGHAGFVYIGRSVDKTAKRRFSDHCCMGSKSSFVDRYIGKYGRDVVELSIVELVEGIDKQELNHNLRELYV